MSASKTPTAPLHRPAAKRRSRPPVTKRVEKLPSKPEGKSWLYYSVAGITTLSVLGFLYIGYELTKPTKKRLNKKVPKHKVKVNEVKKLRPEGDYYEIVVKRGPTQAIGIVICPGENKKPGAFVAACQTNIKLGLKLGSQLVEVNGKWLDSDMNFKETAQLLAKSCSPEGKLCFKNNADLHVKWTKADKTKTEGNELFKQKKFDESILKYGSAIELHPTNKVYYSNKVLALLSKAEHCDDEPTSIYHEALADCRVMRELDVFETYQKGHHVRGVVLLQMGKYKHARTAFLTVLRIDPSNKKALARLKDCKEAIAKAESAEAEKKKKELEAKANGSDEKTDTAGEDKLSEKPKDEVTTPPDNVTKESQMKKEAVSLTDMVEDLKQEIRQETETSQPKKNEEEPCDDNKKVEEAREDTPETSVHQNETHSSVHQNETHSLRSQETNNDVVVEQSATVKEPISPNVEKQLPDGDISGKIVEEIVKKTVEKAVGQIIESGGEQFKVKDNEPDTAALATMVDENTEDLVDQLKTHEHNVEGEIINDTIVNN